MKRSFCLDRRRSNARPGDARRSALTRCVVREDALPARFVIRQITSVVIASRGRPIRLACTFGRAKWLSTECFASFKLHIIARQVGEEDFFDELHAQGACFDFTVTGIGADGAKADVTFTQFSPRMVDGRSFSLSPVEPSTEFYVIDGSADSAIVRPCAEFQSGSHESPSTNHAPN
jgi:hypothetical protein